MLVVLSQLMGSGHHLPLSDPLLQVVHLPVELEETETLVQLPSALLCQILQPGVQLIHLRLAHPNTLTAGRRQTIRNYGSFLLLSSLASICFSSSFVFTLFDSFTPSLWYQKIPENFTFDL